VTLPPNDPRHGTPTGYREQGCRCVDCTGAHKDEARIRRESRRGNYALPQGPKMPMDWIDGTQLCAGYPIEDYYPPRGSFTRNNIAAVYRCYACPLLEPCQKWALETAEPLGIWGGLTASQRRAIRSSGRVVNGLLHDGPSRSTLYKWQQPSKGGVAHETRKVRGPTLPSAPGPSPLPFRPI
jgi:WhiB family redox-sensing transcriptional regulator